MLTQNVDGGIAVIYNGLLIQEKSKFNKIMKSLTNNYCGLHRFYDASVQSHQHKGSYALEHERMFHTLPENPHICNQFISNYDLAQRYKKMCELLNIDVRILFIESNYPYEIWKENIPKCIFLGYEVTEIPLGIMTLYDLYTNEKFEKYRSRLNENGLFSDENDANEFMTEYNDQLSKGLVGDGAVDLYMCRVYEVLDEHFLG